MDDVKVNGGEKKNKNVLHICEYSVRLRGLIPRFEECFPQINHFFYIIGSQYRDFLTVFGENIYLERERGGQIWKSYCPNMI